jgi:hypothetical protein
MNTPDHGTICVDIGDGGVWRITLPDTQKSLERSTLKEASEVAHAIAAEQTPVFLLVRDAYHNVLSYEAITDETP